MICRPATPWVWPQKKAESMNDTPDKNGTETGRKRRGMRTVLIVSLGLNLLIVGLLAGAVFGMMRHNGGSHRKDSGGAAPYVRALEMHDKRQVGRAIREAYRSREIDRRGDYADYHKALAALRATPFDGAAMEDVLARQKDAAADRFAISQDVWFKHVAAMSDPERADYADRLEQALERKPRRGD